MHSLFNSIIEQINKAIDNRDAGLLLKQISIMDSLDFPGVTDSARWRIERKRAGIWFNKIEGVEAL